MFDYIDDPFSMIIGHILKVVGKNAENYNKICSIALGLGRIVSKSILYHLLRCDVSYLSEGGTKIMENDGR